MIRMLPLVEPAIIGMSQSALKEAMKDTDKMVGLTQKESLDKKSLKKMVRSEYLDLMNELAEKYPKIEKKLEEVRKDMYSEYFKRQRVGSTFKPVLEKRIQTQTLSELIEIPVNELILYAKNCIKTTNESVLVDYALGHFIFRPY